MPSNFLPASIARPNTVFPVFDFVEVARLAGVGRTVAQEGRLVRRERELATGTATTHAKQLLPGIHRTPEPWTARRAGTYSDSSDQHW